MGGHEVCAHCHKRAEGSDTRAFTAATYVPPKLESAEGLVHDRCHHQLLKAVAAGGGSDSNSGGGGPAAGRGPPAQHPQRC